KSPILPVEKSSKPITFSPGTKSYLLYALNDAGWVVPGTTLVSLISDLFFSSFFPSFELSTVLSDLLFALLSLVDSVLLFTRSVCFLITWLCKRKLETKNPARRKSFFIMRSLIKKDKDA